MSLRLHLGFMLFPNFLKCWKLKHIKRFNFQHYCETEMSQIIVFWSKREIKMPRNVAFRLNREIKMQRNSKTVQKYCEIKTKQKFHAETKIYYCNFPSLYIFIYSFTAKVLKMMKVKVYHVNCRIHMTGPLTKFVFKSKF